MKHLQYAKLKRTNGMKNKKCIVILAALACIYLALFALQSTFVGYAILDFEQYSKDANNRLILKMRHRNAVSGSIVTSGAIYVDGKWRYIGSK